MRDRFRFFTTQYITEEAERYGFHLPSFVETRTVGLREEDKALVRGTGLSPADVSLRGLADSLAEDWDEVRVVSEDDELLEHISGSWTTGRLLCEALGPDLCQSKVGYIPRTVERELHKQGVEA